LGCRASIGTMLFLFAGRANFQSAQPKRELSNFKKRPLVAYFYAVKKLTDFFLGLLTISLYFCLIFGILSY
jgi:hypothetical protein